MVSDPLRAGLVTRLDSPGGLITGVMDSAFWLADELVEEERF